MYVNTFHRQTKCLMAMDTSGLLTHVNLASTSLRQVSDHEFQKSQSDCLTVSTDGTLILILISIGLDSVQPVMMCVCVSANRSCCQYLCVSANRSCCQYLCVSANRSCCQYLCLRQPFVLPVFVCLRQPFVLPAFVCLRQPFVLPVFMSPPTVRAASIYVSANRSCCQYLCSRDFV